MKLAKTGAQAIREHDSFSRTRRTLSEGIATLAFAGVLAVCGGAQGDYPQRTIPAPSPEQQHSRTAFSQQELRESHVVVLPLERTGTRLRTAVLAYEPAPGSMASFEEQELRNAELSCIGQGNYPYPCELLTDVRRHMLGTMGTVSEFISSVYQMRNGNSVQGANLTFEYFAPNSETWGPVPGCELVSAATRQIVQFPPLDTQPARDVPVYFAECDISSVVGSGTAGMMIRITFVPQPGQDISPSSAEYGYRRP